MVVGFGRPTFRRSERQIRFIRPSSTSPSASSTRRALSIVTTLPPRSSSALLKGASTDRRDRKEWSPTLHPHPDVLPLHARSPQPLRCPGYVHLYRLLFPPTGLESDVLCS